MPLDGPRTAALLRRDEGERLTVYDDATGKALVPGITLEGWPTIGVGRNLADPGLTCAESAALLAYDIDSRYAALVAALPWVKRLDPVRSAVLVSMAFMGVAKLLRFRKFLPLVASGFYQRAAEEMLHSRWAVQTKTRATRLSHAMRTGEWPEDLTP